MTSGGAPTKTFREAALCLNGFEKESIYGISLAAPPEVMYTTLTTRAHVVSAAMQQATLDRLQTFGVQLVSGSARLEDGHTVLVRSATGEETRLHGDRIVLATGSRPLRPASVAFEDPWVFDSEEIMEISGRPRDILIVGGGAVGVEYATIFAALGVPVTIVDTGERGQTSCPSVFAAGDVTGAALASIATDQGRQAVCGAFDLNFSAVYGMPEVARAGMSEQACTSVGIAYEIGRCELGSTPRGLIAGEEGLLKLVFRRKDGALLGVHVISQIASELVGTGQAMIHGTATIEDVLRMAYSTPTYTYGYKLAGLDAMLRFDPDVLGGMRLPSQANRV